MSLKDISDTQLEALMRYDSPPETSSQITQMSLSNESSKNNNQKEPLNYCVINDIEKLQLQSQVDFPIFYNDAYEENLLPVFTSSSVNKGSTFSYSQNFDCISLDTKKTNIFSNAKENKKNQSNNLPEKKIDDDFEEIDAIYKSIDLDSFSRDSHLNINTTSIGENQVGYTHTVVVKIFANEITFYINFTLLSILYY